MCTHYGDFIGELEEEVIDLDAEDATSHDTSEEKHKPKMKTVKVPYHDFPPPEALTGSDVEATLRNLGFGYRAKYIYQTACVVANEKGGIPWLESLMNPEALTLDAAAPTSENREEPIPPTGREGYRAAHAALLELTGVGPKVADCVCLMGLGWGEAVPVDTHVWQIAVRDYKFGKGGKNASMTKALYDAVGEKFRALWGKEAGWAHSVLFTADLSDFKTRVTKVVVKEEDEDGNMVQIKQEMTGEEGPVVEEKVVKKRKPPKERDVTAGQVKRKTVVEKAVKREWTEEETKVIDVREDMMSRIKRRRSGR